MISYLLLISLVIVTIFLYKNNNNCDNCNDCNNCQNKKNDC